MITDDCRVLVLPSSTTSWSSGSRRRVRRPLVGVVFDRECSHDEDFALDLAVALHTRGGDVFGIGCSSPAADQADLVSALTRCREGAVEVLVSTMPVWRGGPGVSRAPSVVAGLDIPLLQVSPSVVRPDEWRSTEASSTSDPGTEPPGSAELAILALDTARLRRRSNAHKRIAIALPASEGNENSHPGDFGTDVSTRSVLALLYALRHAGFRLDRIPPDLDAVLVEEGDPLLPSGLNGRPMTSSWGARSDSRLDLGNVVVALGPPLTRRSDTTAWPAAGALGFGRQLGDAWRVDTVIHLGPHTMVQWLPRRGERSLAEYRYESSVGDLVTVVELQDAALGHAAVVLALSPPTTWLDGV